MACGMQRGFSLVETIVAAGLLAVALVSVAQLVGVGVQSGAAARARAQTTLMAEQKMEQIRAMTFAEIAGVSGSMTDYLDAAGSTRCASAATPCGDAVYVRRWSATQSAFSNGVLIIEVDVRPVGHGHGSTTLLTARARMTP
jgi:prepilin-type N-terminal cleavage/methylation domain-containing protein